MLACLLLAGSHGYANEDLKLPNLGESSTSMFSAEFEHQLGRTWLKIFRSQVPTVDDPLLFDYLENLIFNLVTHSQLEDRRIEIVLVDNPTNLLETVTDRVTRQTIAEVLSHTDGNRSQAARLLGVSRPTLLAKMRKFGLQ